MNGRNSTFAKVAFAYRTIFDHISDKTICGTIVAAGVDSRALPSSHDYEHGHYCERMSTYPVRFRVNINEECVCFQIFSVFPRNFGIFLQEKPSNTEIS